MRTDDILNLDCTKEENIEKVNKFLLKVKPVQKILDKNAIQKRQKAPLELLEQAMHGIMIRYGYRIQNIDPYYEKKENDKSEFVFYIASILRIGKTRDWIGNVYGKTMWEVVAKAIIKVYADLKKEEVK